MLKVSTPDGKLTRLVGASQRQEYLDKGWIIEDTSEVEMILDEDGNTMWRYKEDTEWNTIAGGSGTDTYKVKVDGTDTAAYLENKLVQGANIAINKANGKMEVSCDIADELPVGGATGQVLAKKTTTDGDVEWVNQSGGSGAGVTVYSDIAALKAVDTTAYTDVQTVQVTTLGLYKFQPASTLIGDNINVITPTTGSAAGRWVKQSVDISEVDSNTGNIWSDKIQEPRMNGKKIKLLEPLSSNKKILAIGSSVMLGFCGASYLTVGKSYTILEQGTTNFTLCGASSNLPGTVFTCTAAGTGTGSAKLNTAYPEQLLTKINTNDTGWTLLNYSIAGHKASTIYGRLWIDGLKNNPGIAIIGACPNNDNLDTQTTLSTISTALDAYEKSMDKIIKACEENGVKWYVVGVYPKNTYTALPYAAEKQLNIALQRKYGKRYINIYNLLDNGSGGIKTIYDTGDGVHINDAGHTAIMNAFPSGLIESDREFSGATYNAGAGIVLGADTTTAKPLESTSITSVNAEAHTFGFDFKPNATQGACVLGHLGGSREININIDSNGYIGLFYGATQIITTTTKPVVGWNRVRVTFTRDTNFYKLYLNKSYLGVSAYYPQYLGIFTVGGGVTPANNAVGVEFRNIVHWTTALSLEEISEDFNNDIIKSCLSYFNPLNTKPDSVYESYGATSQRRMMANSTQWILGTTELDNEFTNTEKTKLANSTSGTFTTNDGKTITVVGGMITSIV